jgi:L-cysteine desulfidase
VATLPIHVVGARVGATRAELARALATSHLVAALLRDAAPSPICHALAAASAGAAAGCVRLLGGDRVAIERACQLVIASAGAPACDGAKPACSLRVGVGAAQAVRCARRALEGPVDGLVGGLVGGTLEETARSLAQAARRLVAGEEGAP